MITLFYLENSRAVRIEWALRELNLEHETRYRPVAPLAAQMLLTSSHTRVYARMNGQTAVRPGVGAWHGREDPPLSADDGPTTQPPEMGRESGFSLNKSPCIQDTNGGIIVTESSAILLYAFSSCS